MAARAISRLPPLPTIQEIIKTYGLSARKQLSQNFLLDLNLTNKIVRKAGKLRDCVVIEVGPGPGNITRSILNTAASQVIVIEKDRRFLPALEILREASNQKLEIIHGDIMDYNLEPMIPDTYRRSWEGHVPKVHIIGNLPFNVSTPLIIRWLHCMSKRTSAWSHGRTPCTLTFQKEVAERMVAKPKSEARCRLSVMCQYLCDVTLHFIIPGKAFTPAPEVDVGVVTLVPKKEPLIHQPFPLVEKINRHLFLYSNKYFPRSIQTLFPLERDDLFTEMLEECKLNQQARPYELSIEQIRTICDCYANIIAREPDIYSYNFRDRESAKQRRDSKNVLINLEEQILKGADGESSRWCHEQIEQAAGRTSSS